MTAETSAVQRMPFKYRLRAWWEGYDLSELTRILTRQPAGDEDDATPPRADLPLAATRAAPATPADTAPQGWTPAQIAAAQIVFGEHSLSPRGDAQLRALASAAGLGPRSRILHIGAELGGIASALERGLGCKVVTVETLPALVAAAADRVTLLTPADGPKVSQADLILVDGVAERAEPLATLLRNQAGGLAQGGQLVLRGLVLYDERAATSARFREWANGEPIRPRLRTSDELTRIVQEARLTIATTSSTSDAYAQDVERHWGDALDRIRALHRDPAGRALIPTLLAEGERWRRRIELIRDGVIGVRQVVAHKRDRRRL
jgi:cyclopropane fatty-acyl-phospholipid synthase-like methyltransferase